MAHEEKSKFLTFHTKIACHTVRNVVGFLLLERLISNTENDEIPCGPRDQRKRCHFSVRCYMIQINPHFEFASLLIAYFFSKKSFNTSPKSNSKQKFKGSHEKLAKFRVVEIPDSVDFFRRKYLLDRIVQFLVYYERITSLSWFSFLIQK